MSTTEDHDLRRRVRAKLQADGLPRTDPVRTWAGPGTGQPCVVCDEPITSAQTEYELQFGPDGTDGYGLRFHRGCQAVWEAERRQP